MGCGVLVLTIVCDDVSGSTRVYADGVLCARFDSNDGYEIARLSHGLPCIVETRNPHQWRANGNWPESLADVPPDARVSEDPSGGGVAEEIAKIREGLSDLIDMVIAMEDRHPA